MPRGRGGRGHYKSKCPTVRVKEQDRQAAAGGRHRGPGAGGKGNAGKGTEGMGKGKDEKGGWSGRKGLKRGGKGFSEKRFKCGQSEHRQSDCTKVGAVDEEEQKALAYHVG